jgi:hypothetical protein
LEIAAAFALQILHQSQCVSCIAFADNVIDNELCVCVNRHEQVLIAPVAIVGEIAPLFATNETKGFVHLNGTGFDIADARFKKTGAMLARRFKNPQDGFFVQTCETRDGTDAKRCCSSYSCRMGDFLYRGLRAIISSVVQLACGDSCRLVRDSAVIQLLKPFSA